MFSRPQLTPQILHQFPTFEILGKSRAYPLGDSNAIHNVMHILSNGEIGDDYCNFHIHILMFDDNLLKPTILFIQRSDHPVPDKPHSIGRTKIVQVSSVTVMNCFI